jgi:hypothetical protein
MYWEVSGMKEDVVKPWVREKHDRLRRYVDISRAVRRRFLPPKGTGGATYIDLYCGPAIARIDGCNDWEEASSLVAYKESKIKGSSPDRVGNY